MCGKKAFTTDGFSTWKRSVLIWDRQSHRHHGRTHDIAKAHPDKSGHSMLNWQNLASVHTPDHNRPKLSPPTSLPVSALSALSELFRITRMWQFSQRLQSIFAVFTEGINRCHLLQHRACAVSTRSSAVGERPRDASCHWIFCLGSLRVIRNTMLSRAYISSY